MSKTDRVLKLLELLQDRPSATGPELARALGTDTRTIRRDITALRDLGIPVEGERGRGGSYRIKPGYRVPPLMFTPGEAAAVALGLMAAKRLGIATDSALTKVCSLDTVMRPSSAAMSETNASRWASNVLGMGRTAISEIASRASSIGPDLSRRSVRASAS